MLNHIGKHDQRARGFTLLEVITVLIIASLLSVVLMQGLSLVLNLRTSLGAFLFDLDKKILARNRLIEPLRGIVPDFTEGNYVFKGNTQQLSGLTINPLFARAGRPTPFTLSVSVDARSDTASFFYTENTSDPVLIAILPSDEVRFKFMGGSGLWSDEWPNKNEPVEIGAVVGVQRVIQLPKVIALDLNSVSEPDIAVAILAKPDRPPREPPF
jgi:prepilin-type N-terminal cleavage/methylation domain-containing protein